MCPIFLLDLHTLSYSVSTRTPDTPDSFGGCFGASIAFYSLFLRIQPPKHPQTRTRIFRNSTPKTLKHIPQLRGRQNKNTTEATPSLANVYGSWVECKTAGFFRVIWGFFMVLQAKTHIVCIMYVILMMNYDFSMVVCLLLWFSLGLLQCGLGFSNVQVYQYMFFEHFCWDLYIQVVFDSDQCIVVFLLLEFAIAFDLDHAKPTWIDLTFSGLHGNIMADTLQ